MDKSYDVIVLGTGLKECILSGMLSKSGKKVLQLDRNNYYGGESASLTSLDQLYKHFNREPVGEKYGEGNWSVDLTPKFLLAKSPFSQLLTDSEVTNYVDFKVIDCSYVYKGGDSNEIFKVPYDDKAALASTLLGMFEKRRLKAFLDFCKDYKEDDPITWAGIDPYKNVGADVFKKFELDDDAINFVGHAIALFTNDEYLEKPASDLIRRCRQYMESIGILRTDCPYVYPLGGLGTLPQAFVRSSAVTGSTCMLDKPTAEIITKRGKAVGVTDKEHKAKCRKVVCDPTYALDRCNKVGQVVRAICILNHPIPNTDNARSVQIIIPMKQVGRKHDIYVCMVSSDYNVCATHFYIATVATTVETDNPEEELRLGFELLGPIEDKFVSIMDIYEPMDNGENSRIFISKSYDASTHLTTTSEDILDMFKRITGTDFNFTNVERNLNVDIEK